MSSYAATSPARPGPRRSLLALAAFALAVLVAAGLGGLAAASASETYAALDKPGFAPPAGVFGPVWSVLYVMIALAGWLTWRRVGVDSSLVVYAVQLVLNACWTPLFFAADRYGLAFAEITLLWVAVVATIVLFARRSRVAALLLVPYLAWVTFAGALNLEIWRLN